MAGEILANVAPTTAQRCCLGFLYFQEYLKSNFVRKTNSLPECAGSASINAPCYDCVLNRQFILFYYTNKHKDIRSCNNHIQNQTLLVIDVVRRGNIILRRCTFNSHTINHIYIFFSDIRNGYQCKF